MQISTSHHGYAVHSSETAGTLRLIATDIASMISDFCQYFEIEQRISYWLPPHNHGSNPGVIEMRSLWSIRQPVTISCFHLLPIDGALNHEYETVESNHSLPTAVIYMKHKWTYQR